MGESMIGYFSLFESNTMGSLTTRKTYGLKGYRDRCPRYPATSGGWRLRPPAYQLSPLILNNKNNKPQRGERTRSGKARLATT